MTQGFRARIRELAKDRPLQVVTAAAAVLATAAAAAPGPETVLTARAAPRTAIQQVVDAMPAPQPLKLVWDGKDVDGDGKADFANPTGFEPRTFDAYGSGHYGASRDGGHRRHLGVDYVARAGQKVLAPISGYITKIGYVYAGDRDLRFVEITNPALDYAARAFYVRPSVQVGDTVAVGQPIGRVHSLQSKYPGGMTDHVHLEVIDRRGRRIDATEVIVAEYVPVDGGVHMAD